MTSVNQVYAGPPVAVTWGDNCDASWSGLSPIAPKGQHASHAPPTARTVEMHSTRGSEGDNRTKILYFSPNGVGGECAKVIRQQGHDLATANSIAYALSVMRSQLFDALVVDCAQYSLDIQNFTAKAQGLQPSLAVFLADEWGDELATGLEELDHVLTMVVDDEFARLAVESRTV